MDVTEIVKGLIIDTPWIDKILAGEKVWEMRAQHTKITGPIALIQKGTKCVVGIANLHSSKGPFTIEALQANLDKHCIPSAIYQAPGYRWLYAWQLNAVQKLAKPIPYQHKSGAVIWVNLDSQCREQLTKQLATAMPSQTKTEHASFPRSCVGMLSEIKDEAPPKTQVSSQTNTDKIQQVIPIILIN